LIQANPHLNDDTGTIITPPPDETGGLTRMFHPVVNTPISQPKKFVTCESFDRCHL
jgi:hypothetical protein